MVIAPNGKLRLCNVPFDSSYQNQILFASVSAQTTYFTGKALHNFDAQKTTFMQKDRYIKVDKNADQLYNINYIMYQNSAFSGKWFYGFVTSIEWLSDQSSAIYYTTDVWQTWHFDLTFKPSFVLREHVADDTIGKNTIEEGLELGPYIIAKTKKAGLGPLAIILAINVSIANISEPVTGELYQGVFSGDQYVAYGTENIAILKGALTSLAVKPDAVTSLYMVPRKMLLSNNGSDFTGGPTVQPSTSLSKDVTIEGPTIPTSLDGYTPKNNKLFTDPYMFCYVHNNSGSGAVYPFEEWTYTTTINTPYFRIFGTIAGNPNFKIAPLQYKGQLTNYDEALSISGFPMCSWNYDSYKAWLAQSGASTAVSTISSMATIGASLAMAPATGGMSAGLAISGFTTIASTMARQSELKKQPPHSKGSAMSGSANATMEANDFFIEYKTIKAEYARIIDNYFTMYGYKINQLKELSFKTRSQWNYLQVNDLNVMGDIPVTDLKKIKSVFSNGITFWHNPANIGNYNLTNGVI